MTYRASWRNTRGFWVLCVVIACLALALGFAGRSSAFVELGLVTLAYLAALRRLAVSIDDQKIRCKGWLTTNEFRWQDITGVIGRDQMTEYRRTAVW
jgi:hypothetical protein